MMGNSGETILPCHTCKKNMASDFSAFFYNKLLNIRSELGLPSVYTCGWINICKRGKSCHIEIDCSHFSISGKIFIFIYLLLLEDNNLKICAENLYFGLLI